MKRNFSFYINFDELYLLPSIKIERKIKALFIDWFVFHFDSFKY